MKFLKWFFRHLSVGLLSAAVSGSCARSSSAIVESDAKYSNHACHEKLDAVYEYVSERRGEAIQLFQTKLEVEPKETAIKLISLVERIDQHLRTMSEDAYLLGNSCTDFWLTALGVQADRESTGLVKTLLKRLGIRWFTIGEFGAEVDQNAWLLVQHADHDIAFQKEILAVLAELAPKGETSPSNYAYLYDRVAVAEGRPQRFGTQGRCSETHTWEPFPIEDRELVDVVRDGVHLGPLEAYVNSIRARCP